MPVGQEIAGEDAETGQAVCQGVKVGCGVKIAETGDESQIKTTPSLGCLVDARGGEDSSVATAEGKAISETDEKPR